MRSPDPEPCRATPDVAVEISHIQRVCWALHRSRQRLIRRLTLRNRGDTPLHDLAVELWTEPEITGRASLRVPGLPGNGTYRTDDVDLSLLGERLRGPATAVQLHAVVTAGDAVATSDTFELQLMPQESWPGLAAPPELLAAHLPLEDDQIQRTIAGVQTTGSARDRLDRVRETLAKLPVAIDTPPAGWTEDGQLVRKLGDAIAAGTATPLELGLWGAALAVHSDLDPVVALFEDGVALGAWLSVPAWQTPFLHDPRALAQSLQNGSLVAFDVAVADTEIAYRVAEQRLAGRASFALAMDVVRARQLLDRPPASPAPPALSRLDRWKQRLLDLSLRNRLLNYRPSKTSLPLKCADISRLEDALAGDRAFRIMALPEGEVDEAQALADGVLHADIAADELDRRLTKLYREARASLEEGGARTLYLALGFVRWYETPGSTPRLAPVLLLPLELIRPSMHRGFHVRLAGEEPRVNVTLLQKLENDFGIAATGLDELPDDEAGVDVPRLLEAIRTAVRPLDGWEVCGDAVVGRFSFTKFLMWRDLEERTENLLASAVVRHLIEQPELPFNADVEFFEADELDDRVPAEKVYCPVNADSSQLAAVFAATAGRSFVLQGPPGTGKSQTITNLISQCLAEGQRVLFVSEKMAALNVVQNRLAAVGLAPFCLELHSNKSKKKLVLEQFADALAVGHCEEPRSWRQTAHKLEALRNDLNDFCRLLHRERTLGVSPFQGIARAIGHRSTTTVALRLGEEDAIDAARLDQLLELGGRLSVTATAAQPRPDHPLRHVRRRDWQRSLATKVTRTAGELEHASAVAAAAMDRARSLFAIESPANQLSATALQHLGRLLELVAGNAAPAPALLRADGWRHWRERLQRELQRGQATAAARTALLDDYTASLFDLDLEDLTVRLLRSRDSFFPLSWWRRRRPLKALRGVAKRRLGDLASVIASATAALECRRELALTSEFASHASGFFGPMWQGIDSDWQQLELLVDWADAVRSESAALGRELAQSPSLDVAMAGAARETAAAHLTEIATAIRDALQELQAIVTRFSHLLDLEPSVWEEAAYLTSVTTVAVAMREHAAELRSWTAYNRARSDALDADLAPLVAAAEDGRAPPAAIPAILEASILEWWVDVVFAAEPRLQEFHGLEHEQKIARFRTLDAELTQLARDTVFARLVARLPSGSTVAASASSEVGILQRQIKKSRGHWPIRKLLSRIPHLLPRLKPCVLMSPLSVAQYLDADLPPFDLVVFDEASQIPVWDAIGAIGRGERLVVVGDSKQLPPTSFFDPVVDDEEIDDELTEDLESILDECIAARLPLRQLKWHYRSRHESLIAFSNYHYYDNQLLTFPSADRDPDDLGMSWHHVAGGTYDRAQSRTNRAEADAIVAEVVRRVHAGTDRSIGVVTFSKPQQGLIEDLIDRARGDDPELDAYLSEARDEPLFVKNLENVQGDERDLILFSVCYGPDQQGRVFMNFGPLNKPGGERRLNVAITRARRQVIVFSTLLPEQIDLSRVGATAVGVRHLKTFLEYADRGPIAIAQAHAPANSAEWDSPFERDVAHAIEQRGWTVHRQIGCSGYRIDMAVVHPDAPGRYLLGIECDGATYHSAKTARDRDRQRQSVLESLGWTIHRIWSTDWFCDADAEMQRLELVLDQTLDSSPALGPEPEPVPVPNTEPEPPSRATIPVAETYRPSTTAHRGDPSAFFGSERGNDVTQRVREVVAAEAPIQIDLLMRRVAATWQIKRITSRVRQRIESILPAGLRREAIAGRTFLWRRDQVPSEYTGYRVPADEAGERDSDDIHPVEIANAARAVLASSISVGEDDLVREVARLLGFQRVGRRVDEDVRRGIDLLCDSSRARREGDDIVLE